MYTSKILRYEKVNQRRIDKNGNNNADPYRWGNIITTEAIEIIEEIDWSFIESNWKRAKILAYERKADTKKDEADFHVMKVENPIEQD
jgi:hypothetical protein